jgi:hypothetical protein
MLVATAATNMLLLLTDAANQLLLLLLLLGLGCSRQKNLAALMICYADAELSLHCVRWRCSGNDAHPA